MKPEGVSLKQAKENVTKIDNYVKDTVSKVEGTLPVERDFCNQWSSGNRITEEAGICVFA